MKHLVFFGSVVLMSAAGLAAAIGGCSSDDKASPKLNPDGSSNDSNNPSNSSDSHSNPGSSSDAGNDNHPSDAATQDDGGQTDNASNPGQITCGETQCASSTDVCCVTFQNDGGVCQAKNQACTGGQKHSCDEAADCDNGSVCCLAISGTACAKNDCGKFDTQVCKTSAECGDAGACSEYTCPGIGKVHACKKPFGCN
jgi:hypothetical protein